MVKGTTPDKDTRHPTALDQNNDPCVMAMAIKRSNTTGLTAGHSNNTYSYALN